MQDVCGKKWRVWPHHLYLWVSFLLLLPKRVENYTCVLENEESRLQATSPSLCGWDWSKWAWLGAYKHLPADCLGVSHVDCNPFCPGFRPASNNTVFDIGRAGWSNSASCLYAETQRWRGGVLHAVGGSTMQYGDTAFCGASDSWIYRGSNGAK